MIEVMTAARMNAPIVVVQSKQGRRIAEGVELRVRNEAQARASSTDASGAVGKRFTDRSGQSVRGHEGHGERRETVRKRLQQSSSKVERSQSFTMNPASHGCDVKGPR